MPTRVAEIKFRTLSPMFTAGANQNEPELRAASLKSAIRSWYRAIDPQATPSRTVKGQEVWREHDAFGGTSPVDGAQTQQSPVLLRVSTQVQPKLFSWQEVRLPTYDRGQGKGTKNGLKYATFSLHMWPNDTRKAIAAETEFTVSLVVKREVNPEVRWAWIAGLWLFGALGALGTRSRRGLGSVEVLNWSSAFQSKAWAEDAAALPDIWSAQSVSQWTGQLEAGLAEFEGWYGLFEGLASKRNYPHCGPKFRWHPGAPQPTWQGALAGGGLALQEFRLRREEDYSSVKAMLVDGRLPRVAPERVAFGLPLTFRFTSARDAGTAEFGSNAAGAGAEASRHASLLRLRLIRLGRQIAPIFVRMDGAVPGYDVPVRFVAGRPPRTGVLALRPRENADVLDRFLEYLSGPQAGR